MTFGGADLTPGGGTDWAFFNVPAGQVQSTISTMAGRADAAAQTVNEVITALGELEFGDEDTGDPPEYDFEPLDIETGIEPGVPEGDLDFGDIHDPEEPEDFDAWGKMDVSQDDFGLDDVGDFNPKSPMMRDIEDPDPLDAEGKPERGDFGEVTVPDDIVLDDPVLGELITISIPEYVADALPTFEAEVPEPDDALPNTNVNFNESAYSSSLLASIQAKVGEWLAGGTGLPVAIQQALFDKARQRELDTSTEAENAAFSTWAARGFSMPPGMLVEQVNVAREKSRLAQNTLEREILIKSQEWEIENLRKAVEQGVALETALITAASESARRAFDAAKYRVEADIALYNAMVSLYNAKMSGLNVQAVVYKTQVEAQMQKVEVYKARIEGEKAKTSINENTVRVYEGQIKALGARVDNQRSRVEVVKAQADVIRGKIEAYKADVDGYAAKIGAEKARFEVYEAQVKAEAAKAVSLEAEANAYAATIRAAEAKANVKTKYIEAKVAAIGADVQVYTAKVGLEGQRVQASAQKASSAAQAYSAGLQKYSTELQASNEWMSKQYQINELRARNSLAVYEVQVKAYDTALSRMIERMRLAQDALKASGQYAAALAQGAMSAIHVSAGMSATGSAGMSNTNSYGVSHNYNYEMEG